MYFILCILALLEILTGRTQLWSPCNLSKSINKIKNQLGYIVSLPPCSHLRSLLILSSLHSHLRVRDSTWYQSTRTVDLWIQTSPPSLPIRLGCFIFRCSSQPAQVIRVSKTRAFLSSSSRPDPPSWGFGHLSIESESPPLITHYLSNMSPDPRSFFCMLLFFM